MCDVEQFYHTHPEKTCHHDTVWKWNARLNSRPEFNVFTFFIKALSLMPCFQKGHLWALKSTRQTERQCDRTLYYTCVIPSWHGKCSGQHSHVGWLWIKRSSLEFVCAVHGFFKYIASSISHGQCVFGEHRSNKNMFPEEDWVKVLSSVHFDKVNSKVLATIFKGTVNPKLKFWHYWPVLWHSKPVYIFFFFCIL